MATQLVPTKYHGTIFFSKVKIVNLQPGGVQLFCEQPNPRVLLYTLELWNKAA
jgi:hypothetical protein